MKEIPTTEAVGHVLCHDLTQIIVGVTKDARFRKGHVVTEEDIPVLLSMGKENLYVWEKSPGMFHEDEGAEILCAATMNDGMKRSEPKEGKIELTASRDGLLEIDVERLHRINALGDVMIATRSNHTPLRFGYPSAPRSSPQPSYLRWGPWPPACALTSGDGSPGCSTSCSRCRWSCLLPSLGSSCSSYSAGTPSSANC